MAFVMVILTVKGQQIVYECNNPYIKTFVIINTVNDGIKKNVVWLSFVKASKYF